MTVALLGVVWLLVLLPAGVARWRERRHGSDLALDRFRTSFERSLACRQVVTASARPPLRTAQVYRRRVRTALSASLGLLSLALLVQGGVGWLAATSLGALLFVSYELALVARRRTPTRQAERPLLRLVYSSAAA